MIGRFVALAGAAILGTFFMLSCGLGGANVPSTRTPTGSPVVLVVEAGKVVSPTAPGFLDPTTRTATPTVPGGVTTVAGSAANPGGRDTETPTAVIPTPAIAPTRSPAPFSLPTIVPSFTPFPRATPLVPAPAPSVQTVPTFSPTLTVASSATPSQFPSFSPTVTHTVTVTFTPPATASPTGTPPGTATLTPAPPQCKNAEPDDTQSQATGIPFGTPQIGCLDVPGDLDYFKLTIPTGSELGTITLLFSAPSITGYSVTLFGPGTVANANMVNSNVMTLVHGLGGAGGDYYVLVSATGPVLGPYSLNATLSTPIPTRTVTATPIH